MIRRFVGAMALLIATTGAVQGQGRTFVAEGSDVAFGLGARHLAMGSTGVATANDPHAMFYNPALIAGFDRPMVSVTRQANAKLRPHSFIGVTVPFPLFEPLGLKANVGFANFPRVHSHSTGAFKATDPQSVFLRFLLPGISGTYDGEIDSKTLVWRWAIGLQPMAHERLKLGLVIDRIDCKTNSCGVHAGSVGREVKSVHATAFSVGVGVSYDLGERVTLAASINDIDTTLAVRTYERDASGTRWFYQTVGLPRNVNAEASWQVNDRLLLAGGYRSYMGTYGNFSMNIQTLNFGAEYQLKNGFTLRGGLWRPIKIQTSNGLAGNLPFPVAPTLGGGWSNERFTADVAVYAHPVMSFHYGRPAPTAEFSLSYKF